MSSLPHTADELPASLPEWLDLAEKNLTDAQEALGIANLILDSCTVTPEDADRWHLTETDLGRRIRRLEDLRHYRSEIIAEASGHDTDELISPEDLARGINRAIGLTRKLLDEGQIPYAERKTPGKKNSPWLIRHKSIAAFNNGRNH